MGDFKTALAQAGMFACLMAATLSMMPRILGQGEAWLDYMTFAYLLLGLTSGFVWIFRVKTISDKEWNQAKQMEKDA